MDRIVDILAQGDAAAPAILFPGRTALPYQDLRDTVGRLAGQLRRAGVGRNDRVAIVLPNGPEMAITFLAAASCAAAAPLNPKYREDEFRFYLDDLGAKVLITLRGDADAAHAAAPSGLVRLAVEGEGGDTTLHEVLQQAAIVGGEFHDQAVGTEGQRLGESLDKSLDVLAPRARV